MFETSQMLLILMSSFILTKYLPNSMKCSEVALHIA